MIDQKAEHERAMRSPRPGYERALVCMLEGWLEYREAANAAGRAWADDGSAPPTIGDDGVLGPEWEAIGNALRHLQNGENGRLDSGTYASTIGDALRAEGFNPDIPGAPRKR